MSVLKIFVDKLTSSLLVLFNKDSFKPARHHYIHDNTDFVTAKGKLKAYIAITETLEEVNEKLCFRCQEAGNTIG